MAGPRGALRFIDLSGFVASTTHAICVVCKPKSRRLSLEDLHFGGPAFRVNNRKYALRWLQTGETILKLPKERQEALFHSRPDALKPMKVGTVFWSVVALSHLNRADLRGLVTEAWSTVVSKTLAREYLAAF